MEGLQEPALSAYTETPKDTARIAAEQAQEISERLRVKELLRFFEPAQLPIGRIEEGKPRIATDTSLTAYAQLAALRLDCQRSFISLIDNSKQYIVAEATRTIGLASENIYDDDDDKLSFGQTVLDFQTGVCPGTLACFTSPDDSLDVSAPYLKASRSYYVMNDMSQLEGYKERSYVNGWPHMRYYAEVPIHSPSGQTIGTLCVVDNKARDGLDLKGLAILEEISNVIMDHLELCVSKIQRNRAERMIKALGQFVEGHDSVREPWMIEEASRLPEPGLRHLTIEERAEVAFGSTTREPRIDSLGSASERQALRQDFCKAENHSSPQSHSPQSEPISGQQFLGISSTIGSTISDTTLASSTENNILKQQSNVKSSETVREYSTTLPSQVLLDRPEDILFRAANLVREAIGLDGVVFFDPRSSDGQLLTGSNLASEQTRPKMPSVINHEQDSDATRPDSHPFSRILSCSIRGKQRSAGIQMPELILRALVKSFAKGGLLHFDSKGILSAVPLSSHLGDLELRNQDDVFSFGAIRSNSAIANFGELVDASELKRIFPDVATLILYPLWTASRDKCVAHCVAWSSESTRILQRQDITYITSFNNSITAQLSRIEVLAQDQAKSAFISLISHELRSPLHGVMASTEMLRDLNLDESSHEVLDLIECCSSTLLDTIDNVLVFSRINRQINQQEGVSSTSAIDMERLVEDTMSVCLIALPVSESIGNANATIKQERLRYGIDNSSSSTFPVVICDIMPGCGWIFETDNAIWKRILMNLLSNALKYTSTGFIIVKLYQDLVLPESVDSTPSTWINVTLSVRDSGKGMSQEYLTHHIFEPFYQENPLVQGTGLGLSIVSRLVRSIGGNIDVTSDEGVGTEVKVTAKLRSSKTSPKMPSIDVNLLSSLKMGFFDLNAMPDLEDIPTGILSAASQAVLALQSTIAGYAANFGLSTTTANSIECSEVDILVIEDFRYRLLPLHQTEALLKPVILLCTNLVQAHFRNSIKSHNVVFLTSPFGPRKFQQCVKSCLAIRQEIMLSEQSNNVPSRGVVVASRQIENAPHFQAADKIGSGLGEPAGTGENNATSILLVEDNPINLKLLVTCVTKMGFDFKASTDGAQAVDTYKNSTTKVVLIFMDIQMPVMDGMEATRRIRQHEQEHSLPRSNIVALTALGSADAKQAALDSGVDMFLTKPVSLKTLKKIIAQHFEPFA